jgi:hypothetical protein
VNGYRDEPIGVRDGHVILEEHWTFAVAESLSAGLQKRKPRVGNGVLLIEVVLKDLNGSIILGRFRNWRSEFEVAFFRMKWYRNYEIAR